MRALLSHPLIRSLAGLAAIGLADKIKHFAAYAALAASLSVAFGVGPRPAALAFSISGLFGIGLEIAQMLGEAGREGSSLDVAANLGGALVGVLVVGVLGRQGRLFSRDRR